MDEKKLIILVQGYDSLLLNDLQHKDYDNNLVKDNSWKEIAGEIHAQDKELSRRKQHCRRMAG
jgi:broad-specificity NMP kinase